MSARVLQLTRFVAARDVMEALGCSRTTAYEHLRKARGGRSDEQRGQMLRVPLQLWEAYARKVFAACDQDKGHDSIGEATGESGTPGPIAPMERASHVRRDAAIVRQLRPLLGNSSGSVPIRITHPRSRRQQ